MKFSAERLRKALIALSAIIVLASLACAVLAYLDTTKDHTSSASYYTSKWTSVVRVNTDASANVTQQQTLTLNETLGCAAIDLSNFTSRNTLVMESVKISRLDESEKAVDTLQLEKTPFSNIWRDGATGPGFSSYALDTALHQLYLFFPETSGRIMVTVEYTINDALTPYRDVSEKTWHLVEGTHSAPIFDSTVQIVLPVPSGVEDASESIYAWCHCPSSSELSVSPDGVITCTVPKTDVWQYAEMRFDFPTSWLTNLPTRLASEYSTTLRLASVQKTEATWIDSWHLRSINSYLFDIAFILICLALLLFSLFLYLRHGRIRLPDFCEDYLNEPPCIDEKLHPSTVGQIWRWNRRQIFDLHAALGYLVVKGVITVEPLDDIEGEYRMARRPEKKGDLRPIDQATLKLMMAAANEGENTVSTIQLRNHKLHNPFGYKDQLHQWHHVLEDEFDQDKYFEPQGRRWQIRLLILAAATAVMGFGVWYLFGHPVLLLSALATAAIMAVMANYLPRRTVLGNNITARAKALRNWIKDDVPADLLVDAPHQQQLMPYALLFDLKEKAIDRAFALMPDQTPTNLNTLSPENRMWYCLYVTALLGDQPTSGSDVTS